MDLSKSKIDATLVFLTRGKDGEEEVLLARKVRKLIVDCFNGFGGSTERKETPRACIVRELKKESGFDAAKEDFEFAGVMTFHNKRKDGSKFIVRVFIFILKKWRGKLKIKENEMIDPEWYPVNNLPLEKMAPSDPFWVPLVLEGKKIKGEAWHGKNQKKMVKPPKIRVVKFLSDID